MGTFNSKVEKLQIAELQDYADQAGLTLEQTKELHR